MSTHFCGDNETVEVILRTIVSVNQLSVYGAVADMCDELAWRISGCSESTGKPVARNKWETLTMPTELSTTHNPPWTNEKVHKETCCAILNENSQIFQNILNWSNCAPMQVS